MSTVAIVIPAAGSSSRMRGADKLLEAVAGIPLLRRVAQRACAVSDCVIVTLPDTDTQRSAALAGLDLHQVTVPDASEGMAASLRRAAAALPEDVTGVMILPADMPDITQDDLATVLARFASLNAQKLVQATAADGTPGHPVVFPADLVAAFPQLTGDAGARSILKANAHRLSRVALPATHALTDLDTPEAWAAWRATTAGI